jgi:hypothetical protein
MPMYLGLATPSPGSTDKNLCTTPLYDGKQLLQKSAMNNSLYMPVA